MIENKIGLGKQAAHADVSSEKSFLEYRLVRKPLKAVYTNVSFQTLLSTEIAIHRRSPEKTLTSCFP